MSYFSNASARRFGEFAKCFLNAGGRISSAADYAEIAGVAPDIRRALRSVGMLTELTGTPLYADAGREFLPTMAAFSALDRIAQMAHQVPLRRRLAALTATIEGAAPDEATPKLVSSFDFTDGQLTALKSIAFVIQSAELASALGDAGTDFLLDQLRIALGVATDRRFFNSLLDGILAEPATGADAQAFRADLAAALLRLDLQANSRPVLVVDPSQAIALSTMENALGGQAFPELSFQGGEVCGVSTLVSDGIPGDTDVSPAGRQLVVMDCQALAVDPGEVILNSATHASVEIEGQQYNFFQENLVGLLAERRFGASLVRPGAVTAISGSYGAFETSP